MSSSLSWIDHDPKERDRMNRILSLFKENDTRDELGIGAIRDSFADLLFPGTSTIQTRLRYMLFVPWIYKVLEEKQVSSAKIEWRAREMEISLIDSLLEDGDPEGVIGRQARKDLKRLPSSVYWAGLKKWGIREFSDSQDQYHRALDGLYHMRKANRRQKDDGGEQVSLVTWNLQLPPIPDGFPEEVSFDLAPGEAEFLKDQIHFPQDGSLFAFLADWCRPCKVDLPWQHPELASFTPEHKLILNHARLFSDVIFGAPGLYNLMLAEMDKREETVSKLRETMREWAVGLDMAEVRSWSLTQMYDLIKDQEHSIGKPCRDFVQKWIHLVGSRGKSLVDDPEARKLIKNREIRLKKKRSRFENKKMLETWSGKAGLYHLNYRWTGANVFLHDLYKGLGRR